MFAEILLLIVSLIITVIFLIRWYKLVLHSKGFTVQAKGIKPVFALLPVVCTAIIFTTLKLYASYDVVDSPFYLLLYTVIGISWLYCGLILISFLFDLSWIDDVLNLKNKAAMFTIFGLSVAISLIYSGANIGDGPAWWCVYVAGGIGLLIGLLAMIVLNLTTKLSERITINRDVGFGVRLFFFFVAVGIILGRSSGGDWVSLWQTVLDFKNAWPVLPMLLIFILIERLYIIADQNSKTNEKHLLSSVLLGLVFVALAVLSIVFLLPPYVENPQYNFLQSFQLLNLQIVRAGAL